MFDERSKQLPEPWSAIFTERLAAQSPLLAVIREQIAVEFGMLIFEAELTEQLRDELLVAVLDRAAAYFASAQAQHDEPWRERVPQAQHERVELLIESVGVRLPSAYDDYLQRHWMTRLPEMEGKTNYVAWLETRLSWHVSALQALLEQSHDGNTLGQALADFQHDWGEQALVPQKGAVDVGA
ncbi:hypothetical protein [Pantoea sp. Cy-639]|uniref:hypothetical protein n=1 Tax=Pantoea sp. Cy-639 TaxID=2608360 RepID=UPI001423372F|nr:hypothetical protein [Pantoea sp. Cy-639]NIF17917.1 hypothetical protein [Pantoea sp. Cy-639]